MLNIILSKELKKQINRQNVYWYCDVSWWLFIGQAMLLVWDNVGSAHLTTVVVKCATHQHMGLCAETS